MEPRRTGSKPNILVYDGDCPFCSRYVKLLRLKESIGPVELINARTDHTVVRRLIASGYDLDEGIVLIQGDDIYFGDQCMTRLAVLSTPIGVFNRLNAAILSSPRISAFAYPILKAGRRIVLRILGRERLSRNTDAAR